mmetsp:Transcript_15575/g.22356  ORF Transcript_15575/g.22356 Transcript_15575/m.22356 type:complete len:236 (-) Transcript_15575:411-1118(-)
MGSGGNSSGTDAGGELLVVTGSGDGTVRVWDGRTSEVRRIIRPVSFAATVENTLSTAGSTVDGVGVDGPAIIAVLPLYCASGGGGKQPRAMMIVVTRSPCAYLLGYDGGVIRRFERDDGKGIVDDKKPSGDKGTAASSSSLSRGGGGDFVAATVSPTNAWLYVASEDGKCFCFNVVTGKVEKVFQSFAEECITAGGEGSSRIAEITGLVHHPHKGIVASYSNEKSQRRGLLTIWK